MALVWPLQQERRSQLVQLEVEAVKLPLVVEVAEAAHGLPPDMLLVSSPRQSYLIGGQATSL